MELYRKRGAVVRWENGVLVRVVESGEASDDGLTFRCAPRPGPALAHLEESRVIAAANAVHALAAGRVAIERLLVSEGQAEHELGGQMWSDRSERVHLSLTRGTLRVLLDLGSFVLDDVSVAVEALSRAEERAASPPASLTLAPIVAAAVLPMLAGATQPGLELWQRAGGIDGRGEAIAEARIDGSEPPNWYRPSYRMRPVRLPLNLEARTAATLAPRGDARAVALLAPVQGPLLRVLIDDGSRVFPAGVRIGRVQAVSADAAIWYPYGAGSFGAEMVL
jgi:hypothetical protein